MLHFTEMGDSQGIVYLEPSTPDAIEIANLPENSRWLIRSPEPRRELLFGEIGNSLTVPKLIHPLNHEGQSEDEAITREGTPWDEDGIALRLGFNIEPRKRSQGFVFGRDPGCDIM